MNWLGSAFEARRVLDQSVSSGLVLAIVSTTADMARKATLLRGSRIAGASCATLSRPQKAREAEANPVSSRIGVSGGPCVIALKLCSTPAGPRKIAVAITTA